MGRVGRDWVLGALSLWMLPVALAGHVLNPTGLQLGLLLLGAITWATLLVFLGSLAGFNPAED